MACRSDRVSALIATAAFAVMGCGDDGGMADGSMPDSAPDGMMAVVVEAPSSPVLTPCPPGWREVTSESVTTCSPWPATGRAECTGVEAHFPGEPGCRAIGTPCPAGDFPDDAPTGAIFVLAGATDGDGSRGAPFGTIRDAVRAAAFDAMVVVGPGTYDEGLAPPRPLTVRGVCPERTVLTNTSTTAAVVSVDGAEVTLENLSIRDAEGSAVLGAQARTLIHLDSVLVEGVRFVGIGVVDGARLEAHDLVVRGVRPRADGWFGRGVDLEYGAAASIARAVIEGVHSEGIFLSDASSLTLEDAVVDGTLPAMVDRDFGHGLSVQTGASAEVRRVVVSNNHGVGIGAFDEGTRIVVEDASIERTEVYEQSGLSGFGLGVQGGATGEARRVVVAESAEAQVFVEAATLTLEDVVVRDASGRPDERHGRGIQTQHEAMLTMRRIVSERNREVGLQFAFGSVVSGEDILVRDIWREGLRGDLARGIGAESDSVVDLARVRITDVGELGIASFGSATQVTVTDVEVSDLALPCVGSDCPVPIAAGAGAYESSTLLIRQFTIRRSPHCGVQVADASSLDLEAGEITDNVLGACVQVMGYDLSRLTDGVLYRDNGANLDATSLPVPEPASGLDM